MTQYIPTESDKAWLRNLLALMNAGGVWGSSWAIYQKIDEDTLAVIHGNYDAFGEEQVEENIERTKTVAIAIGKKFIDRRKGDGN